MADMVEPRILTGFMELLPEEQIAFNQMRDTIRSVYESFGFVPLDTPEIELSQVLLAKAGGETEKQIYRFTKGDHDLALRFDLTVPLARYVSMHENELVFPFKRYQIGKVFRGERPQKGRLREFYQCDIDVIGSGSLPLLYDAEMPAVITQIFQKLDFGPFHIQINNRKVLNGFLESIGILDKAQNVLRIIDKLDKIGEDNVRAELLEDGLEPQSVDRLIQFIRISGTNDEILQTLSSLENSSETFREGVRELTCVIHSLRQMGVEEKYFVIDLTIARGLDYYTGTVYETRLLKYPQFGSVCSGGRYENLTGFYSHSQMPGIGISIGLSRLFYLLRDTGLIKCGKKTLLKAMVIPMGREQMDLALSCAASLRNNGISADVYYGEKGMKQKMKYASRLQVPYVVLIGEDEARSGSVSVKNMSTGSQETVLLEEAAARIAAGED